jgi:hypothetical protein
MIHIQAGIGTLREQKVQGEQWTNSGPSNMHMEAVLPFETSITFYHTMWRLIPHDSDLRKILESHISVYVLSSRPCVAPR